MNSRALYILGGAGAFLALICMVRGQFLAERYYSEALRTHHISADVRVHGRDISVRSGEVLEQEIPVTGATARAAIRLAYARTLAERSPFFALPGTSPAELTYATGELEGTAAQLAASQEDPVSADAVRDTLYPIDFLYKAAAAEAARIEFLSNADATHEQAYYAAVRDAYAAYILDIRKFRGAVARTVPDATPPYVAAGKLVSKASILSAAQRLEAGARRTRTAFDSRIMCLHGRTSHCDSGDLLLPTMPEPPTEPVSRESLRAATAIKEMYANVGDHEQLRRAPLIVLNKSVCASDAPSPSIFSVASPGTGVDGPPLRRGIYMGDIRLIELSDYAELPFYRDIRSKGIDFVLSPPLLHYECMEEARDLSAILFTQDVMRQSTTTYGVYYESDAIRLANAIARAGDSDGIRYVLAAQDHSTHFDQIVRSISWIEQTNVQLVKKSIRAELSARNLFFSRSGFVSLFMAHNPSFVGHVALFESVNIPPSERPYVYYSELPDEKTRSKALQDIGGYVSLHLQHVPITP